MAKCFFFFSYVLLTVEKLFLVCKEYKSLVGNFDFGQSVHLKVSSVFFDYLINERHTEIEVNKSVSLVRFKLKAR